MKVGYTIVYEVSTEEEASLIAEFIGTAILKAKSKNKSVFKVNSSLSVKIPDFYQKLELDNK